jgi:muramoyltetrapeptide carboxypeptidase LdcA involved in peptidoglycan recycling
MVRRFFRSLAATGDLQRLAAILFGRPGGADLDPATHGEYDDTISSVVREEEGLIGIPIITGMDFGHTDPAWTVPVGALARVDPASRTVRLAGTAVTPAVR